MALLPTVPFGDTAITRLIIGGNPLRGNSHWDMAMSKDMEAYFTVEQVKKTLFACERHGINTVQARGDVLIQACMREYWAEGGTLQWIVQTASELRNLNGHVQQLAGMGAKGVYVHGTFTDAHFQGGDMSEVEDLLKAIRDTGVQVGLGTHIPEVIDLAEEKGWDIDFYMNCMYNLSRKKRESALVAGSKAHPKDTEHFDHEDKWAMLERVRQTSKTCIVFKILGASRLCATSEDVREAFATTFQNIKPNDAVIVGMFPKYKDQVEENTRFTREILDELAAVSSAP